MKGRSKLENNAGFVCNNRPEDHEYFALECLQSNFRVRACPQIGGLVEC